MASVVSLFDYTAEAVKPWAASGYSAYCFDIQHKGIKTVPWGKGDITYVEWDALEGHIETVEDLAILFFELDVHAILSFTPCTDLAVSGSKHFASKLAEDPDCQNRATRHARIAEALSGYLDCRYMVENPVSALARLWRKPNERFHPWQYAGYIPSAEKEHPLYPEYIPPYDLYTKKTCLWTSPDFVMPPIAVKIDAIVNKDGTHSTAYSKTGGKSLRVKNIRSATPRGFAKAVFAANNRLDRSQNVT
jgi:hypothetical protein